MRRVSIQKIALAAEDIVDACHAACHHSCSRHAIARGHAAEIEGFFHMIGIADVTRNARGLLGAKRKQMSYFPVVESEEGAGCGAGAERAAYAVRAAQGSGQGFRIERVIDTRGDVV